MDASIVDGVVVARESGNGPRVPDGPATDCVEATFEALVFMVVVGLLDVLMAEASD